MCARKSQTLCITRPSLSQNFMNDLDIDEDYVRRFKALLCQNSKENNYELVTSNRRRPIKHVAVQTTPEIDERHYSWLLNMESKADAMCVDVSNLLNTLQQAKNWDSKRKRFEQNPLSLDFILNKTTGDKKNGSIKSEFEIPGFTRLTETSNLQVMLMLQNIENKMKNVLKRATELRSSIPVVCTDNFKETSEKSIQTISCEQKNNTEKNKRSELYRENWIDTKAPRQGRTKTNPISTDKAVTFKLQRSTTQIPIVNNKTPSMLKKQVSSLNSNWKDRDFTTAKTSTNFTAKKGLTATTVSTEKDMRATGAIPKKTNDLHVKASTMTHKRTDCLVTKVSKTKKATPQKPIWR